MNKKILTALAAGVITASCVHQPGPLGSSNCVIHTPTTSCTGNPNNPVVTLNLNTMKANPPNVCGRAGKTMEVRLVPPPSAKGTVAVVPKNFSDTWLLGTNDPDPAKIFIEIPDWVAFGSDHDYGFVKSTGECADPRLHVM
ncbi:MAG: hypothetical protein R3358_06985 [Woeseiaceae bacterium]|nr:hypothetical protein [Woeseiaceae bacterium]